HSNDEAVAERICAGEPLRDLDSAPLALAVKHLQREHHVAEVLHPLELDGKPLSRPSKGGPELRKAVLATVDGVYPREELSGVVFPIRADECDAPREVAAIPRVVEVVEQVDVLRRHKPVVGRLVALSLSTWLLHKAVCKNLGSARCGGYRRGWQRRG